MITVHLPYEFKARPYQEEPWNAFMAPDFLRGVLVVPRRNGKDILCWNALICKAMQEVGLYYYIAPYYNQIRQIIWEGFDDSGRRFLDYIPTYLIKSITKNDMRIDLINGSQIKMQGSDEINRIVGTNPRGIVFTEYSLHKPLAWEYLRPILANNGGWAIFNGTPRGMNHLYDVFVMAEANLDWYSQFLTRDDTGIPSLEAIQADRDAGMPEELIRQEYYCSFLSGSVGTYFGADIEEARKTGRVTSVPYTARLPVHTCSDIGGTFAVWFFQTLHNEINWIDYYEQKGGGFPKVLKTMKEKPYAYGTHVGPWDLTIEDFGTGVSRYNQALDLGIEYEPMPKLSIDDGVTAAHNVILRSRFDAHRCHDGLQCLAHHKAATTGQNKTLSIDSKPDPKTKWASHGADSYRYGSVAIEGGYISNNARATTHRTIRSVGHSGNSRVDQLVNLMVVQGLIDDPGTFARGGTLHPQAMAYKPRTIRSVRRGF